MYIIQPKKKKTRRHVHSITLKFYLKLAIEDIFSVFIFMAMHGLLQTICYENANNDDLRI
jgi:hypothetical protein